MAYRFQRRLLDSVRERSGTLFALASGGLLARIPWVRLADSEFIVVPVSVVANVAAKLGLVATAVEFALLYVIYASIAPSLIPEQADSFSDADEEGSELAYQPLDERAWFRRLVAVSSLGFAVLLYYYLFVAREAGRFNGWFLVGSVGWSAVSIVSLTVYLHRTTSGLARGHPMVELLDAVTPFDDADDALQKALNLPEPWRRVELATWWLATGFLLVIPVFLFGLVGGVLFGYFPLLEGLVVGWLALEKVAVLFPAAPRIRLPDWQRVDIDSRLFESIETALSSIKGAVLTMFAFLGVTITAGTFSVGVARMPGAVDLVGLFLDGLAAPGYPTLHSTAILLGGLSGVLTSLLVGTYGLWYWLRVLRRLPLYLAWWQDARRSTPGTTETVALSDVPSLPPGYMLPPSVLVALFFDWASPSAVVASSRGDYLFLWGLALLVTLWTVVHAVRRPLQDPRSDGLAVPVSVAIQLSGFFVGSLFTGTTEFTVASLWLLLLMAYYLPDVYAVAGRHEDGWLRFGDGGYLLAWAGVFATLSLFWPGGTLARLVAAFIAMCGLALLFGRAWDDRFHRK